MRLQSAAPLVLVAAIAVAPAARAQVVSNPNQIRWTALNTSPEPAVQGYLAEPMGRNWYVAATSVDVTPVLVHRSTANSTTRTSAGGEITVQAGDPGIAHAIEVQRGASHQGESYTFSPLRSDPVASEPAPDVEVTASECVAFITVSWRSPTGDALPVTSGRLEAFRGASGALQAHSVAPEGATTHRVLVRADGGQYRLQVSVTTGTDTFSDLIRYVANAYGPVECGRSIDLTHQLPFGGLPGNVIVCEPGSSWTSDPAGTGGPQALGRIVGRFDLLGQDEHLLDGTYWPQMSSLVHAEGGPWGNQRHDILRSRPSSGAFELENLVPSSVYSSGGDYLVHAKAVVGTWDRAAVVEPPWPRVRVGSGATVDMGDLFVVAPAFVEGAIRFAAPPLRADRADSLLADLQRWGDGPDDDPDGDGVPPTSQFLAFNSSLRVTTARSRLADGTYVGGGAGSTEATFAGALTASGTDFVGSHEIPVASYGGGASEWRRPQVELDFDDTATPGDPLTYHDGWLTLTETAPVVMLLGGERATHDLSYCFGELRMLFRSTAGTFRNPSLSTRSPLGTFDGLDFEGVDRQYVVSIAAGGTPRTGSAAEGLVVALVPEARDYILWPEITAVNPGGGTSTVQLPPVTVDVGCRQVVLAMTNFVLSLDPLSSCVETGTVTLHGSVLGNSSVDRIVARVEGGATIEACAPCGVNPTFDLEIPVDVGLATIVVEAEGAAGERASVVSRVPILAPPSDPPSLTERFMVAKSGAGALDLSWPVMEEAEVHAGTLDALWARRRYDHGSVGACHVAGGRTVLPRPDHDAYFLVRGTCGSQGRSLGRDSFGWQRAPPAPACR